MHIDPRVAHGRAEYELSKFAAIPGISHERLTSDLVREVRRIAHRPGLDNREYFRRLVGKAIPALRRMGAYAYPRLEDNRSGIHARYITIGPEGVSLRSLTWWRTERCAHGYLHVRVKPHAIARCMQRNGAMLIENVFSEVGPALLLASCLATLSLREGWKQFGVPTRLGIFVGRIADDCIQLETYFKPGENGRFSRWTAYVAYFRDLFPPDRDLAILGQEYGKVIELIYSRAGASGGLSAALPFLRTPHTYLHDRDTALWEKALAAQEALKGTT